ncbi:MAG: hypothetical protein IPM34_11485 [Saprospiraceae bacterium]|nr:hypothetical protein [Saprospiraceae bacterium]
MKNMIRFSVMLSCGFGMIAFVLNSCDSRHVPRTIPDSTPPKISVRLIGEHFSQTYTIEGVTIEPTPPEITPDVNPGKTYRAIITASDTVGLFNLRVGLHREFFEITDATAAAGVLSSLVIGNDNVLDVTLPISPAKTSTILTFTIKAKPMTPGTLAPFLGMNVIATDFGEAGRSSNVSGYTIPIAYFAE